MHIKNIRKKNTMTIVFERTGRSLLFGFSLILLVSLSCKDENDEPVDPIVNDDEFRNPILTAGPDPWVIKKESTYYVTHTTGNSLKIYKTTDMSKLAEAASKTVWTAPANGMNSKNIWAPELHYLNNKWYFYYAADDGNNANHRMWVLENSSADPFQGTWIDKGELELPDDKWAIDGSVFSQGDQLYFIWSGWEGDVDVRQDIYITRLSDPWTAEGDRVRLSKPELSWELNGSPPGVNEGPQMLKHNDKLFIVYSASGCWTDDYTLGFLSADANADLMDPAAWAKSQQPVFTKYPEGQAFGPGHCSFFTSPDNTEDWILYHANPQSGQGCGNKRSIRMQPFTWKADGTPDFGKPAALDVKLERPSGNN
jgi:GH43 family beta-xylosidase